MASNIARYDLGTLPGDFGVSGTLDAGELYTLVINYDRKTQMNIEGLSSGSMRVYYEITHDNGTTWTKQTLANSSVDGSLDVGYTNRIASSKTCQPYMRVSLFNTAGAPNNFRYVVYIRYDESVL